MGFFQNMMRLFGRREEGAFVRALPAKQEEKRQEESAAFRARHLPTFYNHTEAGGGRAPRRVFGLPAETLRYMALRNPYLRAVIDVRKREVAESDWDIVPALERKEAELDTLRQLVQSVRRFEDRGKILDGYKPHTLPPKMVADLIDVTRSPDLPTPEVRYRFTLGLNDLTREANAHAARVRRLFDNPNPSYTWRDILRAVVPDILVLDSGCIELVRRLHPLDPTQKDPTPKPTNEILQLHWVDGGTVRPVIDESGQLAGLRDPHEVAFEQWINNQRVASNAGWKRHELLRIVENPQTDVRFLGYGYSRVETLAMTMALDALSDKADHEEYVRDFFGGFLNIKDESFTQEDISALRIQIEEELEGTKKIPLTAFKELQYVSTTPHGANRDKRSMDRRKLYMQRVCAIFEIPPVKLGNYENANYSTSETAKEMGDDGLRSLLGMLDRKITDHIVRSFGFDDIKYQSRSPHLRDDPKLLEIAKKKLDLGIWSVNDARLAFGKEPTDEGEHSFLFFQEYEKERGRTEGGGGMEEGEDAMNTEGDEMGGGDMGEPPPSEDAAFGEPPPGEDAAFEEEETFEEEVEKSLAYPLAPWPSLYK